MLFPGVLAGNSHESYMRKLHAKVTHESYKSYMLKLDKSYMRKLHRFLEESYTKLDKSYIKLPTFENLKAGFLYLGMKVTYNSSYFMPIRPQDEF